MENRFGFKDLAVLVLLASILVSMWLMMAEYDRQWDRLNQIDKSMSSLTQDITSLRRAISEGHIQVADGGSGNGADSAAADVFARIRKQEQKPDYARGDWYVESFSAAPPTLNPLMSQDLYATIVQAKVVETLGTTDYTTRKTIPLLARGWQESPDGLTLTVQLRDNVTFSDGHPMSADDVIYSYDMTMDPEITDGRMREWYKIITKVEKLGPLEVRFHFEKPFFESVDRALSISVLPKHIFEKYTKRQIREHTCLMVGTGPYRMRDYDQYTPGTQVELLRNERYWGEPGPWDRIIWRIIENDTTELITFKNGELDAIQPLPDQHQEMLKDQSLLKQTQHFEYDSARFGYNYLAWNEQRKGKPTIFADKRVRQAMTMLIDRQRLLDEVYLGIGSVAHGPFHHLSDQFNHEVERWPYDPDRAIKQLESLGFKRDANGTMFKPDGTPFEFELVYPAGSDFSKKIVLFVHDNLARAGIKLNLNPQKWQLLLKSLNEKDFDAITLAWSSSLETDPEQAFHTRSIAEGDNRNSYSDPELDKLIDKAHVTLNRDERMKIWKQCDAIINEDQPYTFLIRQKARVWFDKRIRGIEPTPVIGLNSVSIWPNPIEWYVPKDQQKRGQ
ncbi:MAG: ABC transporter substrate-binding protein [Phycisphaera sp.]|nr:ABC transporter substrate-binding protein [Phycisphaera sp.]